jgi:hypothetical protein
MRRRLGFTLAILALESALALVSGCASRNGPRPLDTGAGPIAGASGAGKFAEVELQAATPSAGATPETTVLAVQTGPPLSQYAGPSPAAPSPSLASRTGHAIVAAVPSAVGAAVTAPYHAVSYALGHVFKGKEKSAANPQVTQPASASPAATPASAMAALAQGDSDHKAPPSTLRKVITYPAGLAWNQVSTAWETEEGYDKSPTPTNGQEVVDPVTGIKGREIIFDTKPKDKPKGLVQKTENVIGTTTNDTERTVFLPLKLLDEFIGFLFAPF